MSAVQPSLSSPRTSRIIFGLGVALLIAAVIVFIVKRDHGSSSATPTTKPAAAEAKSNGLNPGSLQKNQRQADVQTSKKWSQVEPGAKLAVQTFIRDGAAEKNLASAWKYTSPSLRQGFTLHQWVHGNALPFQVYPEMDAKIPPSITLVTWSPRSLEAEVGLASTYKKGRTAHTFQIGAEKVGTGAKAHWVVTYWNALYTPPVHADPSQTFGG